MTWDDNNDEFNFDFDDLSPAEKEEIEREIREKDKQLKNHPLFKKANEIFEIAHAFVETLSGENKEMYELLIIQDSMMLAPKLAGAMGSDSWLICMQNASIIRYHAESLLTQTSGLKAFTKADRDYVQLLRNEMLEFQKLFKQWVATFDLMEIDEYEDEWGLFIRSK